MGTTMTSREEIKNISINNLPNLLIGADTIVPTMHGQARYINFDNAASTPTFQPIADALVSFLKWYSNVHRGTGFKSQLASWAFEKSRDMVADFVNADLDKHVVIFTKNATDAINKLSRQINFSDDDIILTSLMEHHSNELPWRRAGRVEHVKMDEDGRISKDDFMAKIKEHGSRIKLVAITGASNVSGYITDIDFFAREAHKIGAKIMLDGAQLVPHRPVDMKPNDPECYLDYLVFSAHKMYAPFGVGILVSDNKTFEEGDPQEVGGGVVDIVTLEEAYWTDLPEKEEAGTPDIVGVVALAKVIELFKSVGWKDIIDHESELTAYALNKFNNIKGLTIYGDTDPANASNRLGVISINVENVPHALVASILSYEGGIGVRSGCFCAHIYVRSLLKVDIENCNTMKEEILARDRSNLPGTIRISFGIYNTKKEIDRLIEMLQKIINGDYYKGYILNKEKGEYVPDNFELNFEDYYKI
ncbi:MAG: aminotransferase class V-fold PLP-dependent enzyme [candidate division Zixibacteria bacterium]|nr:aminotransferase class V-fold PLP-dependent enzyme [candidate division Zixibacteria bacterium]